MYYYYKLSRPSRDVTFENGSLNWTLDLFDDHAAYNTWI
jgi:hypothetical protein